MAIVRWEPLFRPWPRLFEDFAWPELEVERGLNVYETENDIVVEAQVPGIPEDQIEVTTEGGVVQIKGEVEEKSVPSRGDWEKAKAEIEDGLVRVTIPKAEEGKPKKIKIKKKGK